ncbi:MAG: hypothetical protein GY750_02775 [Lentisphaerae bacterium]|nr:hypothetical protein [Lentisphaerota bacterium]
MTDVVNYKASPTMKKFHKSNAFVRAMFGPIGSGKSVACCIELLKKGFEQKPNSEGIRKSRFAIIRNTYRELVDTTIKTFFDWWPEDHGNYLKKDMSFTIEMELDDGSTTHIEFLFRALDKPDDIKKLLSLELTGAWINEAREIQKPIMDMLIGRLGRYPNMRDGGATWWGLIMDTNPPDSDSWWYQLFEVDAPENFICFKQPSGTSPEAENIKNLPEGYYDKMQAGKTKEWINVYVHGKYGFVTTGKPVWPQYKDDIHSTEEDIIVPIDVTIVVGIDFGLTPAAVFGYETASGRWIIFDELVTFDMGAKQFGRLLAAHINRYYPHNNFDIYGDPAGDQRVQTDEITPFQILDSEGVSAVPTYTNDPIIRLEAVAGPLTRLDFSGNPGFLVGPKAIVVRKAMAGGYCYKRMAVSGSERFMDKPDKGRYSHTADALQYLMVGAGEGGKVIENKHSGAKIKYLEDNYT